MSAPGRARGRWLAHPVLSLVVGALWLVLQGSLAPLHWIGAALAGLVVPRVADPFLAGLRPFRTLRPAPRLLGRVLRDIVVANVAVARIVLDPRARPRPAWVRVPFALEHPRGVALLASIVTTTPGTVSCAIDEERRELVVHALDCDDPAALVAQIRERYEAPLKEMFG